MALQYGRGDYMELTGLKAEVVFRSLSCVWRAGRSMHILVLVCIFLGLTAIFPGCLQNDFQCDVCSCKTIGWHC